MSNVKRTTVYFDSSVHRALRLKAADTEQSVSEIVNAAVRYSLLEGDRDLAAFAARASQRDLDFETFVKGLKRRGEL